MPPSIRVTCARVSNTKRRLNILLHLLSSITFVVFQQAIHTVNMLSYYLWGYLHTVIVYKVLASHPGFFWCGIFLKQEKMRLGLSNSKCNIFYETGMFKQWYLLWLLGEPREAKSTSRRDNVCWFVCSWIPSYADLSRTKIATVQHLAYFRSTFFSKGFPECIRRDENFIMTTLHALGV